MYWTYASGRLTPSSAERNVLSSPYPDGVERGPATTDTDLPIAIVVIVLVVFATLVWFVNAPAAVEVADAEVADGNLMAFVNSCGGDLSVDVYDDDSLVRVRVLDHRFRIRFGGGDCQDGIQIPLSVPLGNRILIDDATGREVAVVVRDS